MDIACNKTDLNTLEAPPAVAVVRRIADGFKAFQILRAGYGSGLFDWLERNGPAEKSAIAAALSLRGAHLGAFLQALEDLSLLARQDGRYILAPGARDALHSASLWYQAPALEELPSPSCSWSNLQDFLSEDWTPAAQSAPQTLTLYPLLGEARRLAAYITEQRDMRNVHTLLCFDGSDGLLAAALCQRLPDVHATIVALPDALQRTQQTIAACALSERCSILPGMPLDPPIADTFDYVVIFHSLYPVRKSVAGALATVATLVVPGGELCCAHWFCLEACETAPGGLRDLDKAVLTDSHPLCGIERFCQRLEEAGLIDAERDDLAGEFGNTKLHFARRPSVR